MAKLRNKALENIVVKKPKSADEISAQDLVVNIHGIQQQIINKGDAASSNNMGNAASSAVSYTHLDVYKRQVQDVFVASFHELVDV